MILTLGMSLSMNVADITATLDSSDGSSSFSFKAASTATVGYIDSSGNLQLKGGLRLDSGGGECATSEMLIVDGRIGVGITGPEYELHVDGEARIMDRISFATSPAGVHAVARITVPETSLFQGGVPSVDSSVVQFTGQVGDPGYGVWNNSNAYWDGSNWRQPRGTLSSRMFTVNYHQNFCFKYSGAGGVNDNVISPSQVAVINTAGDLGISGEIASEGTGDSSFMGNLGIGLSNPDEVLHTIKNVNGKGIVFKGENSDTGTSAFAEINLESSDTEARIFAVPSNYTSASVADAAQFYTGTASHLDIRQGTLNGDIRFKMGSSDKMIIHNNGKISVGSSTTEVEFDVNGDIHARNPLYWEAHFSDLGSHTTTTSTTWVDYPGMSVTFDMPENGAVLAKFSCSMFGNNTVGSRIYLQMLYDGAPVTYGMHYQSGTWELHSSELHKVISVTKGTHTIKLQWKVDMGTAYGPYSAGADVGHRTLTIIPLS